MVIMATCNGLQQMPWNRSFVYSGNIKLVGIIISQLFLFNKYSGCLEVKLRKTIVHISKWMQN